MANSADPDQIAPKEQFDQGLYCLLKYICLIIKNKNGKAWSYGRV